MTPTADDRKRVSILDILTPGDFAALERQHGLTPYKEAAIPSDSAGGGVLFDARWQATTHLSPLIKSSMNVKKDYANDGKKEQLCS